MYEVILYDNPDGQNGTIVHSSNNKVVKIEGTVKKEINKIDSFNFAMYPNNPGYGQIRPFKTFVHVLNTRTNKKEFKGRVYGPSESMNDDGSIDVSYLCEGELSYLHDSQQRHLEFRGTTFEALETIINYHNSQVEEYKHFKIGNIEIQDPNDYMYFYLSADQDSFDALNEKLVDKLGGELQIRNINGINYLDWLHRVGYDSNTEIRLAKNLKSVSRDVDPSEIVTRLTPLGERLESEDEEATDASEARLTIESINNGLPYIDRPDLIETFGIQGGAQVWDDVTTVQHLMTNGRNWINNQKEVLYQYELEALDLSLIGLEFDSFDLGNSHPINNPIMSIIEERLRIVGTALDINKPEKSNLTFGDKFKTASAYLAEMNKSTREIERLRSNLDTQTRQMVVIRNAHTNINERVGQVQETLNNSDLDNLPTAIEGLNQQLEAIRDSIYNLPVYNPVTYEEDGLMLAGDKQKLDKITVDEMVDLNAHKQKLDLITVLNNVDLDALKQKLDLITVIESIDLDALKATVADLETRVETLEGDETT